MIIDFSQIGLLPSIGDNVAIATKKISAGIKFSYKNEVFEISHTILEGHRFAIEPISIGDHLLSWGLPFGTAIRPIRVGEYVANSKMLESLSIRDIDFDLPKDPNFSNDIPRFELDPKNFRSGTQVDRYENDAFFDGFARSGNRGVGTRNFVVLLGTSSRTASFAKALEDRFRSVKNSSLDGVVAVTHTEGGEDKFPNNFDLLIRTITGFLVNPNIAAIIVIDYGDEPICNKTIKNFMIENGYPIDHVPHNFFTINGNFDENLDLAEKIVSNFVAIASQMTRTKQSIKHLKIALQCGGSDAFSGVSGNPLAAITAREIIRYGGSANLAETDELIGAEEYVLKNVRSIDVAEKFLKMIDRFQERVGWHGQSAEGNPSGGNNFRGLYNIAIKSIGAAMKRHPDVRLDHVIDYGEPMTDRGYYFMDSPGNDLESIAGQIASGCNMIFFVTGNGSITNFPFVPTIKIITTTDRYEMLKSDMDVNAGAIQDGTPLEKVGSKMFDLTLRIASGELSIGEKAGHSQVSIWRNWRQTNAEKIASIQNSELPNGKAITLPKPKIEKSQTFTAIQTPNGLRSDQIGLILPTSLCPGQIAEMIAKDLNRKKIGEKVGISRFVALAHTEGCGVSGSDAERLYSQTLIGHLIHRNVAIAVLLEHGCEKTHNDYIKNDLGKMGIELDHFGWASVQLDGGIESVTKKVENWIKGKISEMSSIDFAEGSLKDLRIGLTAIGKIGEDQAIIFAELSKNVVSLGGTIVVPRNATLFESSEFLQKLEIENAKPTITYGQNRIKIGFHIMDTPTDHVVETLTGIGSTDVDLIIAHVVGPPIQSHKMLPVIQITTDPKTEKIYGRDFDLVGDLDLDQILTMISEVASRRSVPKLHAKRNFDFQFTRGLLGVSM